MKSKRFGALLLALVMTMALIVVPANAVSFTDMVGHWAKNDVEDLATRGVVNGTSGTTFSPDQKMTACEALLFASRAAGVDATAREKIAAARADELTGLLPTDIYTWAYKEMAVCLETGIISTTELQALSDSGGLVKAITRENLAMYLVRAMQLAPMAESFPTYTMTFADTASIAMSLQPYVYLLNMFGIVHGNQKNEFLPKESLTRGEMATMLRRAIDCISERGIATELPEYTSHAWVGGTIAAVTTGDKGVVLLTLSNELSGARSISLPATVKVYENNMLATTTALKAGQYARVNLDDKGAATTVRLGGVLTTHSGTIADVTDDHITINVDGISKRMKIDRFTEVQVGKSVGDRTLIDLEAGYSSAICKVDEMGHLAALQLTGGTRQDTGIITSVEVAPNGGQTIQVAAFNGVTQRYTLPAGAGVTVNGLVGTVNTSYTGYYANMRVSNEGSNQLVSIAVDTVTQYIQGSVRSVAYSKIPPAITIADLSTGKTTTYNMATGAVALFSGSAVDLAKLETGSFATLRLSGGEVVLLDAYPGSTKTTGVISSITYGVPTVIDVKKADDTVVTYSIDLASPPTIYRSGKLSAIDKIRTGDQVVVTVRYNQVENIETTPQLADLTGIIKSITMATTGVTMEVTLTNGVVTTYTVAEGVSVVQDGKVVSVFTLKPNYKIAMVLTGDQVTSIEVDASAQASNQLKGTVLTPSTDAKTVFFKPSDGSTPFNVDVSGASFIEAVGGGSFYLSGLKSGDTVQIFGAYENAVFKATVVIRM